MDLIILQDPHGTGFFVRSGTGRNWLYRDDVVAILPGAGWCEDAVLSAVSRESWAPIREPLACVLGCVGEVLRAPPPPIELDDTGTVSDTVCSCCRREREAPPPAPQPTDPNVPRLTEEALAQHTREHERDRSRSPVRAASPSAEASR
jgi:hypothetical protein